MEHLKVTGSTWIWKYEGKLWPVVLCDDSKAPREFMDSRSKPTAVPAILLGKHKYIWVAHKGLQEVDPSKDYSNDLWQCKGSDWEAVAQADGDEGSRCTAFKLDMVHWQDDAWWCNYIHNEREARMLSQEMEQRKRKRPYSDDGETFENGRERNGDRQGRRASRQKDNLPTPDSTNRTDSSVEAQEDGNEVERDSMEEARAAHRQQAIDKQPIYTEATIFVGESHTPFFVTRDQMGPCAFLCDILRFDRILGNHVNLYEETDITEDEFRPVWEYLRSKDFKPRLVGRETPQVEDVFMEDQKDPATEKVAAVYVTAGKLQLSTLQRLCLKKFKTLYPLSTHGLVLAVKTCEAVGDETDGELRAWLVNHTAERFFLLLEQNHLAMQRLLHEHEEFREDVIARLHLHKDTRMRGMG